MSARSEGRHAGRPLHALRQSKSGPADENTKLVGIVALLVALALCGAMAQAQQSGKIFRIGVLDDGTAFGSAVLEAFWQEMRMARQLPAEFEGALDSSNHPSLLQFDIPIDRR